MIVTSHSHLAVHNSAHPLPRCFSTPAPAKPTVKLCHDQINGVKENMPPECGFLPPRARRQNVRFSEQNEVREYEPAADAWLSKLEKPNAETKRESLTADKLADRLEAPDTTGLSKEEAELALPIQSQRHLLIAQQKAQNLAKMGDTAETEKLLEEQYTNDALLVRYIVSGSTASTMKLESLLQLGLKDSKQHPVRISWLVKQGLTRNACLRQAAQTSHNLLSTPNSNYSGLERAKFKAVRRDATAALLKRVEEKEARYGEQVYPQTISDWDLITTIEFSEKLELNGA